jgi:hypothetical protein
MRGCGRLWQEWWHNTVATVDTRTATGVQRLGNAKQHSRKGRWGMTTDHEEAVRLAEKLLDKGELENMALRKMMRELESRLRAYDKAAAMAKGEV